MLTRTGFLRWISQLAVLTGLFSIVASAINEASAIGILPGVIADYSEYSPTCDGNTLLMIRSDSTDGSAVFQDSGGGAACPHTIEANGHVHHETDVPHAGFGATAIYFDGTDDYLRVTTAPADWAFGLGDFTIDFWLYSSAGGMLFATDYNADNKWSLRRTGANKLAFTYASGAEVVSSGDIPNNTWIHLAIERYSGTYRTYFNGVADATTANLAAINFSVVPTDLFIGIDETGTNDFTGYLDEIRISNVARYQGINFTPPAGPYCQ